MVILNLLHSNCLSLLEIWLVGSTNINKERMGGPRITSDDLNKLLKKKGYGIESAIKPAIERAIKPEASGSGEVCDLESGGGYESLREEAVAINYAGKCVVRIKFFRKRLADYSRANCEKYLIDSLTYAGLIRDDSEKEIWLIDEGQEKVDSEDKERVEIVIEYQAVDFSNLWVSRERLGNLGKG